MVNPSMIIMAAPIEWRKPDGEMATGARLRLRDGIEMSVAVDPSDLARRLFEEPS